MDLRCVTGKAHDLSAARIWGILRAQEQAGVITLADKSYQGAEGTALTPYKGKNKPGSQKQANRAHARLRGPGERANAQLKRWKILHKYAAVLPRSATLQGHRRPSEPPRCTGRLRMKRVNHLECSPLQGMQ